MAILNCAIAVSYKLTGVGWFSCTPQHWLRAQSKSKRDARPSGCFSSSYSETGSCGRDSNGVSLQYSDSDRESDRLIV